MLLFQFARNSNNPIRYFVVQRLGGRRKDTLSTAASHWLRNATSPHGRADRELCTILNYFSTPNQRRTPAYCILSRFQIEESKSRSTFIVEICGPIKYLVPAYSRNSSAVLELVNGLATYPFIAALIKAKGDRRHFDWI